MTIAAPQSAKARILAAHRPACAAVSDRAPDMLRAFGRALRTAAMPFAGFRPELGEGRALFDLTLSNVIATLPATGLLVAVEDRSGRRGLFALDHGIMDALIEVQTTGRVEEASLPPRPVTRIDEALSRDFIDLVFAAFAREIVAVAARDWPDRVSYGSRVGEPAQLPLLMPDRAYHLLDQPVMLRPGRAGRAMMVLPVDPALSKSMAPGANAPRPPDPAWTRAMERALTAAPLTLNAVLMRLTLPLAQVQAFGPGTILPFDRSDLGAVTLEDDRGAPIARGSLGQLGGRRAVRLAIPAAASDARRDDPTLAAKASLTTSPGPPRPAGASGAAA